MVTKHPNTGGLVSVHTVSEQIVYEIGPPGYLSPDVVARFDSVQLTQDGPDRVRVTGARGEPAPEKLKVSISYQNGWRAFGRLIVSGPDTLAKANKVVEAFWESAGGRAFYDQALHQFIGWNACHPPLATSEPGEVLLQFAVRDQDERKINTRFAPQLVPRVLATVPGISYIADQGRPRVSEVIAFWPALVSRDAVQQRVVMGEQEIGSDSGSRPSSIVSRPSSRTWRDRHPTIDGSTIDDRRWTGSSRPRAAAEALPRALRRQRRHREHRRDRAVRSDLRVDARSPDAAFVERYFDDVCQGGVERFLLPNLLAMNFLLHQSLGGGGTLSLQLDAQGQNLRAVSARGGSGSS